MIALRSYQTELRDGVYQAWHEGHRNVLAVLATGGGKTLIKAHLFHDANGPGVAIAHRQELVCQISMALASVGVFHRIIAPDVLVRFCVIQHIHKFGRSFHHENAPVGVAGIDTLLRRADVLRQWCLSVRIWDIDEAHHVLSTNKWGKGVALFENAWGVGFTATPTRADRKSLGSHKSGVFDKMVLGMEMRALIREGFLSDYRMFGPPASYVMDDEDISANTGDYNPTKLREKSHNSKITGDIVEHYTKIAGGKLGLTFVVDVETAIETANAYTSKGIPAAAISAKTPDHIRQACIEQFNRRDLLQLVNVDLFGEGFDVPGVEVVSLGRKTMSLSLYRQQTGRALRPFYALISDLSTTAGRLHAIATGGKPHGIIIDHVENVIQHGPPDRITEWTLDEPERKKRVKGDDEIPVRTCLNIECMASYEAVTNRCPYCGTKPVPASRSVPEFVDGDLTEYDPAFLAKLRGEIENEGFCPVPLGASPFVAKGIENRHREKIGARNDLREAIALWAGIQREIFDRSDSESYRRFYFKFGIDVASAQLLDRAKSEELTQLIRATYT